MILALDSPFGHLDVTHCEACWTAPVTTLRVTSEGRDLLCAPCAVANNPPRVLLFPPFGIYRLTEHRLDTGRRREPGLTPNPPSG
ncbi:hypothetical protein [Streptomyces tsukubensis]|uniref:hypothetical protein n=1 Tax=Streptomyces tsukubensis TaxID=83656 RepID=UPI00025CDA25|nr:hypothetical protein [Streptomyces tsukubensis]AZK98523.1 hypothetical protein B7R87_18625 [Streptomyces tsukubensis]EIF91558.1 hypothetical protein [Streptomyces tsukubensis NRRL18488]